MDPLVSNIGFSDHCLVTCQLLVNLPEVDLMPVEGHKWKGFSVESFKSGLSKSALCGDFSWTLSASVDELFDRYSYEMSTLLNFHAPRCRKRRKKHLLTPWFDDGCTAFKRSTRRLEKKYQRTRQDDDRKEWIASLEKQSVYFCKKEQLYWSAHTTSNSSSSRKLWQDLDLLMRKVMINLLRRRAMLRRQKTSQSSLLTRLTKLDEQSMVHQIQTILYTLVAALMLSNT